jgi:hypothetical protein
LFKGVVAAVSAEQLAAVLGRHLEVAGDPEPQTVA